MNKFGLESEAEVDGKPDLAERLAAFSASAPRHRIDVAAMDAAAANHGFVSRESAPAFTSPAPPGRRRRIGFAEPTRHLAIRITAAQYSRFVAFADLQGVTYGEALIQLLDKTGH